MRRPRLPKTSVHTIISVAVAVLSVASLLAVFAVIGVAYRLNERVDRLTQDVLQDEAVAQRTVNAVQHQMVLAMQYVYSPSDEVYQEFRRVGEEAYRNTRQYLQRPLSVSERRLVERIKEGHERFEVNAEDAFALADRGLRAEANRQVNKVVADANGLQAEIDEFLQLRRSQREAIQQYRDNVMRGLWFAGAALALVLFAITIFVRRVLERQLVHPLALLTGAVRRIGAAELNVHVPVQRHDEIGVLATSFNDMAERLRGARESAEQSLQRYTQLVESVDALVWEAPADTTACTFVSRYAETLLGYPLTDWIGQPEIWRRIIHPDDFDAVMRECAAATASGENHVLEYRVITRDGRTLWLRDVISVAPAHESGSKLLHGVMFDVTAEREAEAALRQSEERFRALIENASDTVTVVDASGNTVYSGPSLASVLGFTPEERAGRSILDLVHPEDLPEAKRILAMAMQGLENTTIELRARHASGGYRWLEVKARNLIDHPAVRGMVINSRDIGDRKAAEAALAVTEANLRQAQKMEAIGQLAGGVAHDFNNLLTAIKGYTQLITENDEHATHAEDLDEIRKAANRAAALTAQLLAFSRKQIQQPEVLDMNAVLSDMERLCRRVIGENIEIVLRTADQPVTVCADKSQMEQVILNLAVNARDAMPAGGTLVMSVERVAVAESTSPRFTMPAGEYVRLQFSDDGIGMSQETIARVFEPFFTTKDVGRGTGLGLATVYGIVKQSNGFIDVDSTAGVGTIFTIWLPCSEHTAPTHAPAGAPRSLQGSESVLVVEDEAAVRTLARRMLERHGYQVTTAEDGQQALEQLRAQQVDVVVADMIMPRMGGAELAAQLAEEFPHLPVVLMSGYSEEEVYHRAREGNRNVRFLAKPYAAEQLLEQVRDALQVA